MPNCMCRRMSFDRLARHYRWMEWVLAGEKLQRCRTVFLEEAREAGSILLVGEGHGRFLPELCRVNPGGRITCVDASARMIEMAQANFTRNGVDSGRVYFQAVPIQSFEPGQSYDLIVTHFFLDCFEGSELQAVIRKLARLLKPGGKWIIADFQVPKRGWRRLRARMVLAAAYRFFRVAVRLPAGRLCDPEPMLAANGLQQIRREAFDQELLYAAVWKKR